MIRSLGGGLRRGFALLGALYGFWRLKRDDSFTVAQERTAEFKDSASSSTLCACLLFLCIAPVTLITGQFFGRSCCGKHNIIPMPLDTSNIVLATVFCRRQLSSTLAEQSNSACDDRIRARHFALKKASPVVPKDTFLSPACLIVLMVDASVTWTAEFQYIFCCRSLPVGSCARVFIAESDSFYAL